MDYEHVAEMDRKLQELQKKKVEKLREEHTSYRKVQGDGKPSDTFIRLREGMRLQISCIMYEVVQVIGSENGMPGMIRRGDVILRPVGNVDSEGAVFEP